MLNLLHTSASSEPSLKTTSLSNPQHYGWVRVEPSKNQINEILEEVATRISSGVQELVLVAHDCGCKSAFNLIELIKSILNNPQQFSLRLVHLYPEEINDELLGLMKADSRILPYLDMRIEPINLNAAKQQITSITNKLRSELPHIVLRGSLMLDSSCQTEEEFQALCQFITETLLDTISIIHLPVQTDNDLTKMRIKTLRELQEKLVCKKNAALIGTQLDVLIEGYYPESRLLMRGRHDGQCPEIDGSVIINDGRKVTAFGKKYLVEITDVSDHDLIGRVI